MGLSKQAEYMQQCALAGLFGIPQAVIASHPMGVGMSMLETAIGNNEREKASQNVLLPFADQLPALRSCDPCLPAQPPRRLPNFRSLQLAHEAHEETSVASSCAPWCAPSVAPDDWQPVLACVGALALPHFVALGVDSTSLEQRCEDIAALMAGAMPTVGDASTHFGHATRVSQACDALSSDEGLLRLGVDQELSISCYEAVVQWPPPRSVLLSVATVAAQARTAATKEIDRGRTPGPDLLRSALLHGFEGPKGPKGGVESSKALEMLAQLGLMQTDRVMHQDELVAIWKAVVDVIEWCVASSSQMEQIKALSKLCLSFVPKLDTRRGT